MTPPVRCSRLSSVPNPEDAEHRMILSVKVGFSSVSLWFILEKIGWHEPWVSYSCLFSFLQSRLCCRLTADRARCSCACLPRWATGTSCCLTSPWQMLSVSGNGHHPSSWLPCTCLADHSPSPWGFNLSLWCDYPPLAQSSSLSPFFRVSDHRKDLLATAKWHPPLPTEYSHPRSVVCDCATSPQVALGCWTSDITRKCIPVYSCGIIVIVRICVNGRGRIIWCDKNCPVVTDLKQEQRGFGAASRRSKGQRNKFLFYTPGRKTALLAPCF